MGVLAIAPGIVGMSKHFSSTPNAELLVSIAVTLPSLVVALSSFAMGSLLDSYGRRTILLLSALTCGLAGSVGYFLDSLFMILLSRFFLGLGMAGLMTSLTTIAADLFSGQSLQRFLGLQSMAMNAGGIIFIGLGGVLADVSWRLPFLLYSLAFLLLIGFIFFVQETKGRQNNETQESHKASTESVNQKKKITVLISLAPLCLVVTLTGSLFYLSPVLMALVFEGLNLSATKVGLALGCMSLSSALIGSQFRFIVKHLGVMLSFVWVYLSMAIGYIIIGQATSFAAATLGLIIAGLGVGIFIPLGFSRAMDMVPSQYLGFGVGAITSTFFFGQFLAPIVSAPFHSVSFQSTFSFVGWAALLCSGCLIMYRVYTTIKK